MDTSNTYEYYFLNPIDVDKSKWYTLEVFTSVKIAAGLYPTPVKFLTTSRFTFSGNVPDADRIIYDENPAFS